MTTTAAARADIKPCDEPCPKCGSTDIYRLYRASNSTWQAEKYGGYYSKYAGASSYTMRAHCDHIEHHCRTCQYDWQTRPLTKPRKARAAAAPIASDTLNTQEARTK